MNEVNIYAKELVKKSNEAFLMSIEVINKPTIMYRTEGFLFYICNAWELILKSRIIMEKNKIEAIDFKDKSTFKKKRTYSLEKCISILHGREDDKIRLNLSFLVTLRNTATHLFIPSFDYDLAQTFQNCVNYYYDYCIKFFRDIQTIDSISPFIAIVGNEKLHSQQSPLFLNKDAVEHLASEIKDGAVKSVEYTYRITKDKNADATIRIDNSAQQTATTLKIHKDVNLTHHIQMVK